MGLSTKNLFHYTNKEALFGILSNGFKYSTVHEDLPIIDPESDSPILAIPEIVRHTFSWQSVCFCDIPIDHVSDHREQYGNYAIGLQKEWAILKQITPVRYVHYYTPYNLKLFDEAIGLLQHSHEFGGLLPFIIHVKKTYGEIPREFDLQKAFKTLPEPILHVIAELESNLMKTWKSLYMSGGYLRAYKGDWKNRAEPEENNERVFYDEKEWRAVSFKRNPENLKFSWDDISHLILPNKNDKEEVVNQLNKLRETLKIKPDEDVSRKVYTYSDEIEDA